VIVPTAVPTSFADQHRSDYSSPTISSSSAMQSEGLPLTEEERRELDINIKEVLALLSSAREPPPTWRKGSASKTLPALLGEVELTMKAVAAKPPSELSTEDIYSLLNVISYPISAWMEPYSWSARNSRMGKPDDARATTSQGDVALFELLLSEPRVSNKGLE
jgi:hypothetical protein